jgi:hypothetical protein
MKISNGILLSLGWSQELEFTNDFVIETEAHYNRVHEIALDHGFDVKGEIFPNHWHFRSQKVNKRSAGDEAFHRIVLKVNLIIRGDQRSGGNW